jgi:outer membrane protein TolC
LPQFSANGSYTRTQTFRGAGASQSASGNDFDGSISVAQLLFDFNRTRDQVRQQEALERASTHDLTTTEQIIAFQVRLAHESLLEARDLLAVAEENVRNRQRQLDLAQARLNVGLGAPGDVVRAKTTLADAVTSLTAARNAVEDSQAVLSEAMGIDPRTPLNPSRSEVPEPDSDLNKLIDIALAQRPELKSAQEQIRAARLGQAVADKTNAPSIDLNAQVGTRGDNQPFDSQAGSLRVSVSWPFGDSGLTAGRQREARANVTAAEARLQDTQNNVKAEVKSAYVDLAYARQRVTTAEEQLANALELVRISEGRYQGGIGTFLEVTDAQSSLFAASRNLASARADVEEAKASLIRAIGAAAV